jgi:hypothetical protein
MKWFGRTSGYYLFWTGFVYFWVGLYLAFQHSGLTQYATLTWLLVISIPLWCPPVARYFNMEPVMFDWFGKKDKESSNVIKFPEPKAVPEMPYVEPPEKPATVFYRFGITDKNRLAFQMGYSEITMTKEGVQNLIEQLEFFKNQLGDDE